VRCPRCRETITVSEPAAAPAQDEAAVPEDVLSALASGEQVGVPRAVAPQATRPCPSCRAAIPQDAPLCPACGCDVRAASASGGREVARSAVGALTSAATLGGRFATGCVASGAGALLGAAVWFVVAAITDYEIGWVAIGVGFLAGAGMVIGYRAPSLTGGAVAAGMAVGAIVVAKLAMFHFVVKPMLTDESIDIADKREAVALTMAGEQTADRAFVSDREFDRIYQDMQERVAETNDAEVEEIWQETREAFEEFAGSVTLWDMLDWMDFVFFGLALVAAFKVGSRGMRAAN